MKIRIRERLDAIDFRSVFTSLLIAVILVGLFYTCIYLDDDPVDVSLAGQTKAKVVSIEPVDMMHQGRYGTRIYTDSYKITYHYTVKTRSFVQTENIKTRARNDILLDEIFKRNESDSLIIRYDNVNPKRSRIIGVSK